MVENFKKLSLLLKTYLVLTCLVGITFLFIPFVKVGMNNVSAFYFPLSLIIGLVKIAIGNSSSAATFDNLISTSGLQVFLTIIVFLTWYIILYFVIMALVHFYKGQNGLFAVNARRGFLVDIAITVIFFILRLVVIRTIADQLPKYIGSYTSYVADAAGDYGFILQFGFYAIFLLGLIGYFSPKLVMIFNQKGYDKKAAQIGGQIKDAVAEGKDRVIEAVNEKKEESGRTGEIAPPDVLFFLENPDVTIDIYALPSIIGSGDEANIIIDDESLSPKHLIIQEYENNIIISDMDSEKGSYLNNESLEPNEFFVIESGDQLRIGNLQFTVRT